MKKISIGLTALTVVIVVALLITPMGGASTEEIKESMVKVYSLDYQTLSEIVNAKNIGQSLNKANYYWFLIDENDVLSLSYSTAKKNPVPAKLLEDGTLTYMQIAMTVDEYKKWSSCDFLQQEILKVVPQATISDYFLFNRTDNKIEALLSTDLGLYMALVSQTTRSENGSYKYEVGSVQIKSVDEYITDGALYVNDVIIQQEVSPAFYDSTVLFPMKATLVAIGAVLSDEVNTGNLQIDYAGETYTCKFRDTDSIISKFRDTDSIIKYKFITIESPSVDNDALGNYIKLSPWDSSGAYEIINDEVYLHQDAGKRLFEALGCTVEIDLEQKILKIDSAKDKPSDWALEEVQESENLGLVPDGMRTKYKFQITRLDFCKLAVLLLEKKGAITKVEDRPIENQYNDTDDSSVVLASQLGIVNGKGNGIFDPDGYITRQEAAAMLYRTAKVLKYKITLNGGGKAFADEPQISDWAKEAVAYVSTVKDKQNDKEVMGGVGNDLFSPSSYYTRQQAYITMKRLYNAG